MDFCASNSDMQEIMEANDQLDETYESIVEDGYELPQEILDDFVIPQIETNNEDFYSYEELTDINDTDIQEETNHYCQKMFPMKKIMKIMRLLILLVILTSYKMI